MVPWKLESSKIPNLGPGSCVIFFLTMMFFEKKSVWPKMDLFDNGREMEQIGILAADLELLVPLRIAGMLRTRTIHPVLQVHTHTLNQHTPHDSLVFSIVFYTINFVSWSESCKKDLTFCRFQVCSLKRLPQRWEPGPWQPTVVHNRVCDPLNKYGTIQKGVLLSSDRTIYILHYIIPFWHPTPPKNLESPEPPRNEATCGMHSLRWNNGISKIR